MSEIKFRLVPVESTSEMCIKAMEQFSGCVGSCGEATSIEADDIDDIYTAMLAASPGNDLLERIVAALENASVELWANGYNASARKCDAVINELGGGHG